MPDDGMSFDEACQRMCGFDNPILEIGRLRKRERELCWKLAERTQERDEARDIARRILHNHPYPGLTKEAFLGAWEAAADWLKEWRDE